jgi:hypothetical protein
MWCHTPSCTYFAAPSVHGCAKSCPVTPHPVEEENRPHRRLGRISPHAAYCPCVVPFAQMLSVRGELPAGRRDCADGKRSCAPAVTDRAPCALPNRSGAKEAFVKSAAVNPSDDSVVVPSKSRRSTGLDVPPTDAGAHAAQRTTTAPRSQAGAVPAPGRDSRAPFICHTRSALTPASNGAVGGGSVAKKSTSEGGCTPLARISGGSRCRAHAARAVRAFNNVIVHDAPHSSALTDEVCGSPSVD